MSLEVIHNRIYLKKFRKNLRNNLTPAEAKLWTLLKSAQLEGRKFRRQHSVGNYILDFYCPTAQIAIELDGEGHFTVIGQEKDQIRDAYLITKGITVLRFENKMVFEQIDEVLEEIKHCFKKNQQPQ